MFGQGGILIPNLVSPTQSFRFRWGITGSLLYFSHREQIAVLIHVYAKRSDGEGERLVFAEYKKTRSWHDVHVEFQNWAATSGIGPCRIVVDLFWHPGLRGLALQPRVSFPWITRNINGELNARDESWACWDDFGPNSNVGSATKKAAITWLCGSVSAAFIESIHVRVACIIEGTDMTACVILSNGPLTSPEGELTPNFHVLLLLLLLSVRNNDLVIL